MALPIFRIHPSEGMVVAHAVLMTLFVMCPAVLGGLAQCYLPKMLGCTRMMLPMASVCGWGLLALGVLILPFSPVAGLALWGVSMLAVACDVIATVLEGREKRFREFPPLVWAFLAMSMALLVMVPVVLALLVKGVSPMLIIQQLRLPEMSLMLIPAVGIVAQTLTVGLTPAHAFTIRIAPYALSFMGLMGPLLWADMLFGGIPSHFSILIIMMGQVIPGLCILLALCKDSWSHSMNHGVAVSWSLGAVIIMAIGWVGMLFPHMLFGLLPAHVAPNIAYGEFGHQAGILGALMALSGAFYTWFSRQFSVHRVGYECAGRVHALVTFIGAVCSFIPQWEVAATFMMTVSLLGYVYLSAAAWRCALTTLFRGTSSLSLQKGS